MPNREEYTVVAPTSAPRRTALLVSFSATSILLVAAVIAIGLTGAPAADAANTCSMTSSGNWTTTSNWTGCAGTYPGAGTGDTAYTGCLSPIVTSSIPNAVILDASCGGSTQISTGGALTIQPSSAISSSGSMTVSGGTLTINGGGTFSPQGSIYLNGGGTINLASGSQTSPIFGGSFQLHEGTLNGPGQFTGPLTFLTDGASGGVTLNGGAQIQSTNVNFSSGGFPLVINGSSNITVPTGGTFSYGANQPINSDGTGGIWIQSGATLSYGYCCAPGVINAPLKNDGTVTAGGNSLQLTGGGSHTGSFSAATSASPAFTFSGTQNFAGTTTFSTPTFSPGYKFTGSSSTFTFGGAVTIPGFSWNGGTITGAGPVTLSTGGSIDASTAPLTLLTTLKTLSLVSYTPGSFTINSPGMLQMSGLSANITFPAGAVAGNGTLQADTSGGINIGTGAVSIAPSLSLLSGSLSLTSGGGTTLTLSGGGSVDAASTFILGNGSNTVKIPSGTLTFADATPITGPGGINVNGGNLVFSNATSPLTAGVAFDSGNIGVLAGNLVFSGGLIWGGGTFNGPGTMTASGLMNPPALGPLALASAAHFVNNGTFNFTPTFGLTLNAGTVFDSATFNFLNDGAVNGTGNFNVNGTLSKSGGAGAATMNVPTTIGASGSVSFPGPPPSTATIAFAGGGSMSGGSMNTTGGGITFPSGTFTVSSGTMIGAGKYSVTGTGVLTLNSTETIQNVQVASGGLLNANAALNITSGLGMTGPATIAGTGPVTATSPANVTVSGTGNTISAPLTLNGAFLQLAASGALALTGGGSTNSVVNTGAGAVLGFGGGTFNVNSGSTVTNSGTLDVTAGSLAINAGTSFTSSGSVNVNGGTLTLGTPITTTSLNVNSGSVTGSALTVSGSGLWKNGTISSNLTIGGSMQWSGGSYTGSLTNNGTLNIDGAIAPMSFNGGLTNSGTVAVGPTLTNALTFASSSISNSTAGSVFDIKADGNFGAGPVTFNNVGTLKKSAGTGTTTTPFAVSNSGTVQVLSGTLQIASETQSGASSLTSVTPGTLALSPGSLTINGGILNGTGAVTGNVVNAAGAVNPGTSPGTLTVNGNYTQQSGGTLNLEIAGTSAGQYDVLNVTGTATLGGTLNIIQVPPYTPAGGNTFTMMTYSSASGSFGTTNVPPGGFSVTQGPTSLAVAVTQADIQVTQTAGATTVYHGQNVTFTVTVTNLGGSTATGVSFSDNITGGTYVSSTTSQGTCTFSTSLGCSIGTLAAGSSATIAVTVNASALGSITNQAFASATEVDPNSANNAAPPVSVSVLPANDLALGATHTPDPVSLGSTTTFTFTINNLGPDPTASFALALTPAGGTIGTVSSPGMTCTSSGTSASCSGTSLSSGSSTTVTVAFTVSSLTGSSLSGTVSSPDDPNSTNNSVTQAVNVVGGADLMITKSGPSSAHPGDLVTYTIVVTNNGPLGATGVAVFDPTPTGLTFKAGSITGTNCTTFPCDLGSLSPGQSVTLTASYTVNANAATITNNAAVLSQSQDPTPSNNSASAVTGIAGCGATPPSPVSPINGTTVSSPVTFIWNGTSGATQYEVFLVNGTTTTSLGKTSTTSLSGITVPGGPLAWYVVATVPNCGTVQSTPTSINACNTPGTPLASVVANAASGQSYYLQWDAASDAASYDVDEATDAAFSNAVRSVVATNNKILFVHINTSTTVPQPYYYRVRGTNSCGAGQFSIPIRVVIAPQQTSNTNVGISVPSGSTTAVIQTVIIPGLPDGTYGYSATVDKPWMSIDKPTGTLPKAPGSITLGIQADPSNLPNGTFTGTVIVILTPLATSSGAHTQGTVTVSVPVSVSLVTPVTPSNKTATTTNSLIIPSVGHLDGINSQWQSDIRLANVGFSKQQYTLTFTPSTAQGGSGATGVKTTTLTVDAGATTALDDVVRNWYGVGSLGETANGVLEIKPQSSPQDGPGNTITTVASSRTYNVSSQGTLGQYIPAIPFTNFVGKAIPGAAQTILSLQQVQQSSAYRTNLGVVEGAGASANVTLSVYNAAGNKLTDFALTLNPYQQVQLNSFLASQNIAMEDGRIEVKVTGGDGKVTAYASVVDNTTNDPFLVSAVPVGGTQSDRYVLPGVAALNNANANWQTDMRIFNGGAAPQPATLTLYPLNGGAPLTATTTLYPGEVKQLNGVVQSLFNQSNLGGALHVITNTLSNLVVTGRTYNQTSNGTYGQFVPAVTANDAASLGGRSLNLLQVEDSPRYRTNLGIAEVSGKPATVQIMVFLPDSKVTPKIEIPLNAYEYKQFPIIQSLGLGNIYNARINIQVIGGDGRVASYASVIDQTTQDPTYVPAQ